MRAFLSYLRDIALSLLKNRHLLRTLAKRDVQSRYRGSAVGMAWTFINPIILLSIYTFIFSVIFKAKWDINIDSKTEFAMVIFSGMIIYNMFSECISRAPSLVISNTNYVKKVVFPLEILPIINIISALFHMAINFAVWIFFYVLFIGAPHFSIFLTPLILIPLILYTAGFSWFLASLGVYLRDIMQVVGLVLTALMFLSPIFYPSSAIPQNFQVLLLFNPLAGIIEQTRNVLFDQAPLNWVWLIMSTLVSLIVAVMGFAWFQKTRKGFSDVI